MNSFSLILSPVSRGATYLCRGFASPGSGKDCTLSVAILAQAAFCTVYLFALYFVFQRFLTISYPASKTTHRPHSDYPMAANDDINEVMRVLAAKAAAAAKKAAGQGPVQGKGTGTGTSIGKGKGAAWKANR